MTRADEIRARLAALGADDFPGPEDMPLDDARLDAEAWDDPIPLDDPEGPPFPVEMLPDPIRQLVEAVAHAAQVPADLAATVALGTLSAASGGKYIIQLPDSSWREPVHLMLVAVAEPGTRKSAIFDLLTRPLTDYEQLIQSDELRAFAAWESRLRVLEKELSSCEGDLSKQRGASDSLSDGEARHLAAINAVEDHRERKPRVTRVIADDLTMEAAKSMLFEQAGALAVMSAESAFLSVLAGRYSDGQPNLDVLLNGHAGERIRVDRKGRPPETIARACLSLCLMAQPDVIRDLGKVRGFIQRGGAARFLPSFPPDRLGRRSVDVRPVPDALLDGWALLVTLVARKRPGLKHGSYDPWSLQLDSEAGALFREYRLWHEPGLARGGRYHDIRDWAGKQCGAVLRIAGLLHLVQHGSPEHVAIKADTLHQAIAIAGYFEAHARVFYRMLADRSKHSDARDVLEALLDLGSPTTRRELHRKLRGRVIFASPGDLDDPLRLLEEHGYIRRNRVVGESGGRPSEVIVLNPRYPKRTDKTDTTHDRTPSVEGYGGFVHTFGENGREDE